MDSKIRSVADQIAKVILGKEEQIRLALTCFLAGGHLLIEDIPGIGKTTLAKVLAKTLGLQFSRTQCTNDMLPGDIIGVSIFDQQKGEFVFHPGPIFTQVLLSDEINRATPKTQSALLEAMEELQVSIDGERYDMARPFFVIATQNPLEQAGTYPLPESQLDRFLMRISLGYPTRAFEVEMLSQGGARSMSRTTEVVLSDHEAIALQEEVGNVFISDSLFEYVQRLLEHSRASGMFQIGLSPRAGLSLTRAARAYAFLEGRMHVLPEDIQIVLPFVTCHRLRTKESGEFCSLETLRQHFQEVALPH